MRLVDDGAGERGAAATAGGAGAGDAWDEGATEGGAGGAPEQAKSTSGKRERGIARMAAKNEC
jgi:hypothetical protein